MKYSWEEKIRAVEHYLSDGSIDYPKSCLTPSQAKTYANHVRFWKAQYLLKGKEGLRHKEFNRTYSPEAKYKIIKPILDGTVSCTEQACRTGIGSAQLFSWVRRYRERGWEGLKCSKPGRPGKNMKQEKEEKEPETAPEDGTKKSYEELEHENLLLKFEVEYQKTESLGGAGNRGKTEAIEELLQGERFGNKIKLGEALGLAGLSKSTYEYDRRRLGKKEDPDEQRIMLEIKAVWLRSKKRYGYRKTAIALKNRYGETVNHKKVLRLRKERDVCAVLSGHGKYPDTAGRILHSDQGWQYQRPAYRSSLK